MKSIDEIEEMLVTELHKNVDKLRDLRIISGNYNEVMGETSYMLAGLLESHLKKDFVDWDLKKWIDDCLLTMVKLSNQTLGMWGVMIWGMEDSDGTEQFTEPFYYEIELTSSYFKRYTFLFGDLDKREIPYSIFKFNREYWIKQGNKNEDWNPAERNWRYLINSKAD